MIVKILCYVVPAILILMLTIDIFKMVMSGEDNVIKNNMKMIVKRTIFAVAIFFVPMIVNISFGLLGNMNVSAAKCYNNANLSTIQSLKEKEAKEYEEYKAKKKEETEEKKGEEGEKEKEENIIFRRGQMSSPPRRSKHSGPAAAPVPGVRRADRIPAAKPARAAGFAVHHSQQCDKVAAGIALGAVKGDQIPVLPLIQNVDPRAVVGPGDDRRGGRGA